MSRTSLIVLIIAIIGIASFYQVALGDTFSQSTTTIVSSQNPSTLGQFVTFTATVTPSTATGNVRFYDTANPSITLGTGTIIGGTATFSTSSLSVGTHNIVANYLGDSSDSTSSSFALTETVNQISSLQQTVESQSFSSLQSPSTQTISIDTVPRVASLLVDDTLYLPSDIPLQFNWKVGSRHTIEISDTTIKNGVGSRYIFDTWTDQSTDPIKTITVKNDISLRALFKQQNYLKINSDFGKVKGEGWYDNGAIAQFSILQDKIVDSDNLHQHIFDAWSDGDSKKSIKNSITMDGPKTINVNWLDQYYLQVTSSIPGISVSGSGWYNKGDQVPLFVDTESKVSTDTKYVFSNWVLKGDSASLIDKPTSNIAILTINGPQTVEADWNKSYYVNVISSYGDTSGNGFYQEGTTANISVSTAEVIISDKQHKVVFSGWSSDSGTFSDKAISVNVDKPLTIVANWKDQFYLNVASKQGTPSGSGWYDSGQVANLSIEPPSAPPGVWVKYVFDGWSGDKNGKNMNGDVIMTEPKNITANWRADYSPAIVNSIIMSVVGGVGLLVYRKTKKKGVGMMSPSKVTSTPTDVDENTIANEIYRDKLRDKYEELSTGKHQQAKEIQDKENFPPFIPALIKEYSDKILAYYYYKLYNDQRYVARQDWLLLIHQEIRERFEKTLKKDEERQKIVPK